jgi:hypothetical protein
MIVAVTYKTPKVFQVRGQSQDKEGRRAKRRVSKQHFFVQHSVTEVTSGIFLWTNMFQEPIFAPFCYTSSVSYVFFLFCQQFTVVLARMPIAVAARSKVSTVFTRSNTEITGGIDVCVRLFCVCVVLCVGRGLATGWSPAQGVLPTVYRFRKTEKKAKAQRKGCRA